MIDQNEIDIVNLEGIYDAIRKDGFSVSTLELIDNYVNDILYGRTNISKFNLQEHAGLCFADSVLVGAYIVASYARGSFGTGCYAATGEGGSANWEIDAPRQCVYRPSNSPTNMYRLYC